MSYPFLFSYILFLYEKKITLAKLCFASGPYVQLLLLICLLLFLRIQFLLLLIKNRLKMLKNLKWFESAFITIIIGVTAALVEVGRLVKAGVVD